MRTFARLSPMSALPPKAAICQGNRDVRFVPAGQKRESHNKAALRAGATPEELTEAIWVAAEMRAGGAYAHSTLMLTTLAEEDKQKSRAARG
jgi:alkylhydroperoxidase/carboxymuconolactone decarboxylase family protein YurZ